MTGQQLSLCKYVSGGAVNYFATKNASLAMISSTPIYGFDVTIFPYKSEKFSLVEPPLNLPQKSLHPDVLRAELSRSHFSLEILNWADTEPHWIPTQKHLQCLQFFFLVIVLKRR